MDHEVEREDSTQAEYDRAQMLRQALRFRDELRELVRANPYALRELDAARGACLNRMRAERGLADPSDFPVVAPASPAAEPGVLPARSMLTARAALNWIAFRHADEVDRRDLSGFWRRFGLESGPDGGERLTWLAERVQAEIVRTRGDYRPTEPRHFRRWAECHSAAADLEAARSLTHGPIAARVKAGRECGIELFALMDKVWQATRPGLAADAEYRRAAEELVDALATGRMTAHAHPINHEACVGSEDFDCPTYEAWPYYGPVEAVPQGYFRNVGAAVNLHGRLGWREIGSEPARYGRFDPDYVHVRFETAEVRALWPEPKAGAWRKPSDAEVAAWMAAKWAQATTHGKKPKRQSAIEECMKAIGATDRQCRAALPPFGRRRRGDRDRSPKSGSKSDDST